VRISSACRSVAIEEVAGLVSGEACEAGCDVEVMICVSCEGIVSGGILVVTISVGGMRSCVSGEVSDMGFSGGSTGVETGSSCIGEVDSSASGLLAGGSMEGGSSGDGV
jgi:hypothetical protein